MSTLQALPSNISYLSPAGFKFALGRYPDVNYFCQSAGLPGVNISTIPYISPLKDLDVPGDEVTFDDLTIKFIVDDNKLKVGRFLPKKNIPIKNLNYLINNPPDIIVIFAWNFTNDFEVCVYSFSSS